MATIPNMNWMGNQPSGSAYDVYQYYLGGGNAGGSSTPTSGGGGGITSLPWYQQTGGGGDFKGGGRYGNLDLSKTKTFNKGVYEVGGPANQYGSFVDKEVQGYLNPTLGGYQTLEGKNINHLGLTVPSIAGMLFDKDFGKGPQPGDIEGTFTKGFESGIGKIKEGWEDETEKLGKVIGLKKNKAKKEKQVKEHQAAVLLAAQEKAAKDAQTAREAYMAQAQRNADRRNRDGSGNTTNVTGFGKSGLGRDPDDKMAEGGMVNDPEYRGWKKMYEANPEIGSMHKKHPSFIKFYKKHERDKKKFGGLAGLLYG